MSATQSIRGATPLQFVNAFGQRLNVDSLIRQEAALAEAQKPRQGGVAEKPPAASRGFEIVGIKVKRLQAAEKRAALKRARWEARPETSKAKEPEPWCAETWLSEQRPQRAMRETFAVESAAQLAAEMLRRQGGWLRVCVLARGEA